MSTTTIKMVEQQTNEICLTIGTIEVKDRLRQTETHCNKHPWGKGIKR